MSKILSRNMKFCENIYTISEFFQYWGNMASNIHYRRWCYLNILAILKNISCLLRRYFPPSMIFLTLRLHTLVVFQKAIEIAQLKKLKRKIVDSFKNYVLLQTFFWLKIVRLLQYFISVPAQDPAAYGRLSLPLKSWCDTVRAPLLYSRISLVTSNLKLLSRVWVYQIFQLLQKKFDYIESVIGCQYKTVSLSKFVLELFCVLPSAIFWQGKGNNFKLKKKEKILREKYFCDHPW